MCSWVCSWWADRCSIDARRGGLRWPVGVIDHIHSECRECDQAAARRSGQRDKTRQQHESACHPTTFRSSFTSASLASRCFQACSFSLPLAFKCCSTAVASEVSARVVEKGAPEEVL